jgi:two-component system, chemotaxis family, sensor kinase Cph1
LILNTNWRKISEFRISGDKLYFSSTRGLMPKNASKGLSQRIEKLSWLTAVVWTLVVLGLFLHDIAGIRRNTFEMARKEATAHFNMDWALRLWGASHGGVYVPVSEKTPPNPFLKDVPERDILTPSGRNLTLMNPAYMLRQMMHHYSDLYGVLGHITSLKPLRPETSPDDWEKSCLHSFELGLKATSAIVSINGHPFFRLMKPLLTEKDCLKCHGNQGYKVGEIRGGVSVSVPLGPYLASQQKQSVTHGVSFAILWLLGLIGIAFFGKTLRCHAEEHQKAEDLYTTVVENSLIGIYIIQEEKIVFANQRFADIYGFSKEEIIGKDSLDLVHPEDRPLIAEVRQRRIEGKEAPKEYEARGLKKDGELIWIQRRNSFIHYEGKPAILGNVLDVTALKKAETAMKANAKELERKNVELDNFASIASHDLREPLRKVQSFVNLLMSKYGQSLDDQGKDYLRRMQTATARMQALIESLLAFSHVTTKSRPVEEINLHKVAEEALSNLEVPIDETKGVVEVDSLPTARVDRQQMVQLFQNLIGNALKFHREGVPPHVKIYSTGGDEKNPASVKICVEDNGIGFDEKYLDRIFAPFERLHGKEQYQGVGMGLAICMKIVERHGGTITAKSTIGAGSTFIVTIPVSPKSGETRG